MISTCSSHCSYHCYYSNTSSNFDRRLNKKEAEVGFRVLKGNSMSNHPIFLDVDTLTFLSLFLFSPFVENVEMINP